MKLKVYNTLTRSKEEFIPLMEDPDYKGPKKDFVGFYSCGPTVYSMPHFGNLRAALTADLIRNVLGNICGYPIKAVMNITDVGHIVDDADVGEEKMEIGAKKEGLTVWNLAQKYENIFRDFFKKLRIEEFDLMPRATEHISEQISLVQELEKKGYTYTIPGDGIYMDTSKIEDYGKLLGSNYKKHLEGIQAGERVDMGGKKLPTDFALRKFSPIDQKRAMERDSPRGKGFPGWHAECSAMSIKYLGQQFDIHHGGYDLIPVHHTNEIAQSECSTGIKPWVKYRMHNQFVNMNGKKMAKRDGNYAAPEEVLAKGYDYLDIRFWCLVSHYRSFLDFTWETIEAAKTSRHNLIKKFQKLFDPHIKVIVNFDHNIPYDKFREKITFKYVGDALEDMMDALMDDLNTPQLLAVLNETLNSLDKVEEVAIPELFIALYRLEKNLLKIGLFDRIGQEKKSEKVPEKIIKLAEQRVQAKKDKNFALSDELRAKITALGREIKDTKDGHEITKI